MNRRLSKYLRYKFHIANPNSADTQFKVLLWKAKNTDSVSCHEREAFINLLPSKLYNYPDAEGNIQLNTLPIKGISTKAILSSAVATASTASTANTGHIKAAFSKPGGITWGYFGWLQRSKLIILLFFEKTSASWALKSDLHIIGRDCYKLHIQSAH